MPLNGNAILVAKINEIIRDAVQIHSSLANDIETQIASSRAMLSWLKLNGVTGEAAFLKSSDTLSDLLISHSLLQTPNEYRYLLEFAGVIETFWPGLCRRLTTMDRACGAL
ncbi:Uncharacterised protein [Citrobacter koseri]|uniref:Uncharacterized protein n=1 Tax=Citrobacter koseri TaxID=545 RepID=A0A2X2VRD7_CITKO|nr:Uncharacterised protein [Citrobacter koseri]